MVRHGCSPVNLLYISRPPFYKNIPGRLLLFLTFCCYFIHLNAWEISRKIWKKLIKYLLYCTPRLAIASAYFFKVISFYICYTLREKGPYSEFFWSAFFRIRAEYGKIPSISPYSVGMRENMEQKNSEYENFLRRDIDTHNTDITYSHRWKTWLEFWNITNINKKTIYIFLKVKKYWFLDFGNICVILRF